MNYRTRTEQEKSQYDFLLETSDGTGVAENARSLNPVADDLKKRGISYWMGFTQEPSNYVQCVGIYIAKSDVKRLPAEQIFD